MKNIPAKLNSRKGSSVIIALFVFLVCAFVSVMVVTSSRTSVSRIEGRVQEEQLQIAAESMAEFLSDNYKGMQMIVERSGGSWAETHSHVSSYIAGSKIASDVIYVCNNETEKQRNLGLSLTVNGGGGAGSVYSSSGKVSYDGSGYVMDSKFNLTFTIVASYKDSGESYKLVFYIPAAYSDAQSTTAASGQTTVRTIIWGDARLLKENAA